MLANDSFGLFSVSNVLPFQRIERADCRREVEVCNYIYLLYRDLGSKNIKKSKSDLPFSFQVEMLSYIPNPALAIAASAYIFKLQLQTPASPTVRRASNSSVGNSLQFRYHRSSRSGLRTKQGRILMNKPSR